MHRDGRSTSEPSVEHTTNTPRGFGSGPHHISRYRIYKTTSPDSLLIPQRLSLSHTSATIFNQSSSQVEKMTFSQIICSSPRHHEHQSEYSMLKRSKRLSEGYHHKAHEHSDDEHSDSHDERSQSPKEPCNNISQHDKRDVTPEQEDTEGMARITSQRDWEWASDRGNRRKHQGLSGDSYSATRP